MPLPSSQALPVLICPHCRSEYGAERQCCAAPRCRALGGWLVPSRLGQVVDGRFELVSILGAGSMSAVWMGVHVHTGQRVAIKVIERSLGGAEEAWLHEVQMTAKAASAHTVELYEVGRAEDGRYWLAMELIEGQSLDDVMQAYRRSRTLLPFRSVVHIATQVCSALACAHRIGVVHQDLKPANIVLVERPEDPEFVKVLDFGVARLRDGERDVSLTPADMAVGTAGYIAPEQLKLGERVDSRADLYSLGVVLYEALIGELPFLADTPAAQAELRLHKAPRPCGPQRPDLPPSLCRLVDALLSREPAGRPADAEQVRLALLGVMRRPSSLMELRQGLPGPERKTGWRRLLSRK